MSRTGSHHDFDHFDEWETFDIDDDIYAGTETDLLEDWEDDGAVAQLREEYDAKNAPKPESSKPEVIQLDEESAEVFSLLERAQSKKGAQLEGIEEPSEDELSAIENIGIDEYIDQVLSEETPQHFEEASTPVNAEANDSDPVTTAGERSPAEQIIEDLTVEETRDAFDHFEDDVVGVEEPMMSFGDEEVELVVHPLFEGVACALPTLFDEDGEVEYKITARLAKRLVQTHTAAVFVGTPAGEGQTLTRKERKSLVKDIVKVTPDTIVVADVTAPSIRQSTQIMEDMISVHADAVVVELSSSVRDPFALLEALHGVNREMPILVRLVGDAHDLPIAPEFLYDLPICGVIDETRSAQFLIHLVSAYTGPLYVASTEMILLGSSLSVAGVVCAGAAIADELVAQAFAGDVDAQLQLAADERDFGGFSPQRIKQVLESQELISSTTRD